MLIVEAEKHLVGTLFIRVARRVERLNKIQVKVPAGNRRRPLIRCAKKQIAQATCPVLTPFDFMLPYLIAGDMGRHVGAFENLAQGLVIETIESAVIQGLRALLDQRIVVVSFLEIEKPLAVVRIGRNKLTADCFVNFAERGFNHREQVLCWLSPKLSRAGMKQA